MAKKRWWQSGVRFQCQGSGKCCASRGRYGYVYLTLLDRRRLAQKLKMSTIQFTRTYCEKTDGYFHLKSEPSEIDCRFLEGNRCQVYDARPTQCRTWPFWPDHMNPKDWNREVASFCPGVGKGKVVPSDVIEHTLQLQKESDDSL